jgi:quercetin dioxygenase-like cupin family protein
METGDAAPRARVVSPAEWGPELPVLTGPGSVREMIGSRTGARLRSMYRLELGARATTQWLSHPGEAAYYVLDGSVEVTSGEATESVPEGGMFHVRSLVPYAISSPGGGSMVGGPAPVDPDLTGPSAVDPPAGTDGVRFFHRDRPGLMVPIISADARLVVWYGVGAVAANMNYVVLEPGERNQPHVHRYSEDTIFIVSGHGTAEDVTNGGRLAFGPGDTVTIPPGVWHAVSADRGERVVSVGGPCPADLDMLRAVGVDVDAMTAQLAET